MGFGIGPQLFVPVAELLDRHSCLAVLFSGFGCHWGLNADSRNRLPSYIGNTRP